MVMKNPMLAAYRRGSEEIRGMEVRIILVGWTMPEVLSSVELGGAQRNMGLVRSPSKAFARRPRSHKGHVGIPSWVE